MMKKLILSILTILLAVSLSLVSCGDKEPDIPEWEYAYNPYYNLFKDDVPNKTVSVSGNLYTFSDAMVRDKDAVLSVTGSNALRTLYAGVMIEFSGENTVKIIDYSGFFPMDEREGVREGNVLTVKNTTPSGDYTYDIRMELHPDKVVLIHNAHTYDEPGTYSTITFNLAD